MNSVLLASQLRKITASKRREAWLPLLVPKNKTSQLFVPRVICIIHDKAIKTSM